MARRGKQLLRQRAVDYRQAKYDRKLRAKWAKAERVVDLATGKGVLPEFRGLPEVVSFGVRPHYMPIGACSTAKGSCLTGILLLLMLLGARSCQAFDVATLSSVSMHLRNHLNDTEWEKNESGFVRARMPASLISNSSGIDPANLSKLRINYWYKPGLPKGRENFGDKSAHDHPNGFTTYMLKGGYAHELFRRRDLAESKSRCARGEVHVECRDHFVYDKKSKSLSELGRTALQKTADQDVHPGMRVDLDDAVIHRIKGFKSNTMTINAVRNDGKQKTNIFVVPGADREVKTNEQRKRVQGEEARLVSRSAIEILDKAIEAERKQICPLSP